MKVRQCVSACGLLLPVLLYLAAAARGEGTTVSRTPLDSSRLRADLSFVRGESKGEGESGWPRTIRYTDKQYDFRSDTFTEAEKTYELGKKPMRIIPHAAGVAEILWAICPRERIAAFNDVTADPKFSFIAEEVKRTGPVFRTTETERVLGYEPDLVFTVFYSTVEFKEKLKQARVPCFDLGYFGTMDSIQYQALLIGRLIGEEGNAEALVRLIAERSRELRERLPKREKPPRVLYYDENGYIPGRTSNFSSICEIIGARNVGEEQGVKSWRQIDGETLLKWDPDLIVVPAESGLKERLTTDRVLSHARAVREGRLYTLPGIYLRVDSQYMLLSANELAGIVYEEAFRMAP
ncbi:MAG: ABC transporter substrate-binding protein [bacterium]